MAENCKNVNTTHKTSVFMIFPEKIANQHREAVLNFKIIGYVILTLF